MLTLYNSLSRRKEAFRPRVEGKVGMYVCGITVYDDCHVGHGRSMLVYDILYRHLLALGYEVSYVRNITDVDDKIIRRALENGEAPEALAERYIKAMHDDEAALGVLSPSEEPRATAAIESMHALIDTLIASGHAYAVEGSDVFYAVRAFPDYGKLSGRKPDELRAGERVAVDEDKRDPLDFVLWKAAKEGEPAWPSPWGPGRPGWHIECSAMAKDTLGDQFDIHGGGLDLKFPHHENEIAQSEAANGVPLANYWVHSGLITVGDDKMSKSLGNFLTIGQALEDWSGEELRLFMVSSHYRSPLAFHDEALQAARTVLRRFYTALRGREGGAPLIEDTVARFDLAMNDDLNTPEAMAVLHELAADINRESDIASEHSRQLVSTLLALGDRLGLLQNDPEAVLKGEGGAGALSDGEIESLIAERAEARSNKDWAASDRIRDQLAEAGVVLEDKGSETLWRRG
ncbi:MAG: cysteine--tRNA ligase [Gammaproteobacteria bacterium]|nr:MAG: cysteine--tRNA ligase [Gammaproteobacteria bacterium]